jgi:ferredoxin
VAAEPAAAGAKRLRVNPIACSGHGLCAELLPELIALDWWGYPVLADQPVPARLAGRATRAVTDCPVLALRLADAGEGD